MKTLHFLGILLGTTLSATRYAHDSVMSSGTYNYYISGYIGSFHYCFVFSYNDVNTEQVYDTLGHLLI